MSSTILQALTVRNSVSQSRHDQLVIEVEFIKERRGIAAFNGVAKVDGDVVCSAELKCARREF